MALFQKVNCMLCCRIFRCRSVIQLFLIAASGDPMIFYAGEFSGSARDRSQMFHGQIETDVAIKIPVSWIARIAFVRTPDLAAGMGIACESSRPRWRITGSVNGAAWARRSKEQPVGVDERTSGDSLPVESIPDRARKRIPATKIRRVLRRKVRHKRRGRSKPAHALREAIAAEGSAASRVLPRWR